MVVFVWYLVVVIVCVSGVVYIYMVVEWLEKFCQQEKWSIKIEIQGVFGIENCLMEEDICCVDVVLFIIDIELVGVE